jgi:hypothetical protein
VPPSGCRAAVAFGIMFEDLNEAAQRVIEIAGEEAVRLNHDFTGTEHLLLGLVLCDDEVASPLLAKHGVVADEVRARVTRSGGPPAAGGPEGRPTALTARAKQVLSLASRSADSMGDEDVRPEHLLLGIIQQETGVAALVLQDKGVDLAELRGEILEVREAMDIVVNGEGDDGATLAGVIDGEIGEDVPTAGAVAEVVLAPPSCPNCGKRLSDVLAVASIAPVGASSGRRRSGNVSVIFCGSCGHTLSVSR